MENKTFSSAQGTIEYLVIIAVIVVLGLLVVGTASSFFDSASGFSSTVGKVRASSGGISVVDAVVDLEGDGIFSIKNNFGETLSISKISVGGLDSNFDTVLVFGNTINFYLENLSDYCSCTNAGGIQNCQLTVYFTTTLGIQKKEIIDVPVDCTNNIDSNSSSNVVEDILPVVTLLAPADESTSEIYDVNFSYSVSDDSLISSCSLIINEVVDQTGRFETFDIFSKTFSSDGNYYWDVNCTDEHGNFGVSDSNWLLTVQAPVVSYPYVTLLSPANSATVAGAISFDFNVNDTEYDIDYCELIIDDVVNAKLTTIAEEQTINFEHPGIANGTYTWDVNCINTNGDENGASRDLSVSTSLQESKYLYLFVRGMLMDEPLYSVSLETNGFTQINTPPEIVVGVTGFEMDANNNSWLGPGYSTSNSIEKFDPSGTILSSQSNAVGQNLLAINAFGNVYNGPSSGSYTLEKRDFNGNLIDTIDISFGSIKQATVDLDNNLWIVQETPIFDNDSNITKISPSGEILLDKNIDYVTNNLVAMVVDLSNNLWVLDGTSSELIKISQNGVITGTYSVGTNPTDVKVDISNNLWVVDSDNIYKVSQAGSILDTIVLGSISFSKTNDILEKPKIYFAGGPADPRESEGGIAITSDGNLWVPGKIGSEAYLFKISPSGQLLEEQSPGSFLSFSGTGDFSGFELQYFILGRR
ncbi:MAG: hypothetical protein HON47_00110 [Candidatus Diapherotrites archaeon]|jgi:hypothetical protein|uniref:Uncharacterized protein n=1 Tax=Candidatus Iainarchaeum sp. TaxID=3101447 RepID=A0A8T5GCW0_9ARCH|nr:hypothetical protein [Candidatus Diapherotrites archaeon]